MALDPHQSPNTSAAPPSFIPAASRSKRAAAQPGTAPQQPPSFTPSGERGKPTMDHTAQQTPVGGEQNLPPRQPRRAGGSSRNVGAASPSTPAQHFPSPSSQPPVPRGNGTVAVTRKKHHPGRIIAAILISLLAIAAILVGVAYSWVNGQLNHFDGLTSRADDSAQTWLITGSDVRDGTEGTGAVGSVEGERTDSIMLLIKPKSGRSALISIPRDTYVTVEGTDMKINAAAANFGWSGLTGVVESLSGLKVDHFVRVGFGGVKNVVDAVGGVELCYDADVSDPYSGLNWTAGCHTADGTTALAFSRMRYEDPQGDIGRAARQPQVIQAVVKKASSKETLLDLSKTTNLISTGLAALQVDEDTSPLSLVQIALAFKEATGSDGITGAPYITDPGYYPPSGIGSTVQIDSAKTLDMFAKISQGTQAKGVVGGLPQ